jgi:hypothetical protein
MQPTRLSLPSALPRCERPQASFVVAQCLRRSRRIVNTGARSPGEELMTCKHLCGPGLPLRHLVTLGFALGNLTLVDRLSLLGIG